MLALDHMIRRNELESIFVEKIRCNIMYTLWYEYVLMPTRITDEGLVKEYFLGHLSIV